jgi:arylsulfatase A-like enzyme
MSAVVTLAATVTGASPAQAKAVCGDCNVLWIVVDTTRADYIGAYGNPTARTPTLDGLAGRGLLFEHGYTQAPSTLISVSSYMSGRHRLNTGMDFDMFNRKNAFHPLAKENHTLAEALQGAGWNTWGATANLIIAGDVRFNMDVGQGFDSWNKGNDKRVVDMAIAKVDTLASADKPFFMYVHLMGPHHPNPRRPGFEERRPGSFDPGLQQAVDQIYGKVNRGQFAMDDTLRAYWRELYADALTLADDHLARLISKLEAGGLDDNTLIVVTSDHGEALGDMHNNSEIWGHGHALTDPLLHVPLIFAGPGVPKGKRDKVAVAEMVDVPPTIAGYLGVDIAPEWRWEGEPLFGPGAVAGTTSISDRGVAPKANSAIRSLTHNVLFWEANGGKYFYYDIQGPKGETGTVAGDAEHKRLEGVLRNYRATAKPPETDDREVEGPKDDMLEQLQQLGYVEE